ncbi:hypothetical protein [Streptomyces griseoaurantiacus]|uniref:hypothetical protein n=1 Tax=Streptomyces griseoaurantiacus TaxID=68213 RepID=UPI0030E1E1CD
MNDAGPEPGAPHEAEAAAHAGAGRETAGAREDESGRDGHGAPGEGSGDPAAPAPLQVPRTPTGNPGVDAHLDRLADADHLATDGHLQVYEDVHRGLRDALTALDSRPGPPPPSPTPGTRDNGTNGTRS